MRRVGVGIGVVVMLLCAASAPAVVIDFESLVPNTTIPQYTESGVTFRATSGGPLRVFNLANSGTGIIGDTFPWSPVRADIVGGASFVSVLLGDNSPDTETVLLQAFDALDNLIGSDSILLSGTGFVAVSVTTSVIDHVIWSTRNTNPSLDHSVIADEFTFERVPEPSTSLLLGAGLLMLTGYLRRRRS